MIFLIFQISNNGRQQITKKKGNESVKSNKTKSFVGHS